MKKFNSSWGAVIVLFALLLTSMVFNFKLLNKIDSQRADICSLEDTKYQLKECKEALNLADAIFDRNDVWDMDGGDEMADYLILRSNIDSTYSQSALVDSIENNFYSE